MADRNDLINAMAKIAHGKAEVMRARRELKKKSGEQLDSIRGPIHEVGQHVEADHGGGILGHRHHKVLLNERQRLTRIKEDLG